MSMNESHCRPASRTWQPLYVNWKKRATLYFISVELRLSFGPAFFLLAKDTDPWFHRWEREVTCSNQINLWMSHAMYDFYSGKGRKRWAWWSMCDWEEGVKGQTEEGVVEGRNKQLGKETSQKSSSYVHHDCVGVTGPCPCPRQHSRQA